ncbi:MAG: penicillin-binding protein 1C, partial [Anaerolineae bacterium]|nr:penicillin-binding protein 1C [Anaerolineae bacterium]
MRSKISVKYIIFFFSLLIIVATGWWLFGSLPDLTELNNRLHIPSIRIEDRYGRLLYESLSEGEGRHAVLPLDQIPLALQQATIATEDRNFYQHPGVDVTGILRAFWINLRGGDSLAGGSTITQQVARNLLLTPEERYERTLRRKLREAWLAWQLSRRYTKNEILALYLNQMNYGGMLYGVEAAAQTYFGKPAARLDLAEAALLAGIPQSPGLYNPLLDSDAAKARQEIVLNLMVVAGYISLEERELAAGEALFYAAASYPMEAPHFVLWVRGQLDGLLTPEDFTRSLIVRTTLDLDWQQHAERAVVQQLERLQSGGDTVLGHNVNNAALVSLDPHTGEILAMLGSPDYFDAANAGAVNMALSPRQPGSALKPLIYAAAFDPNASAQPFTPATMLMDVRTAFITREGEAYTPSNYDLKERGPVLVREALASSLNIPAVAALDYIGLESLFAFSADLGITTFNDPDDYDLSIALGGGAVRLLELTGAYGAFANGGWRVEPYGIQEIYTLDGEMLYTADTVARTRVLDERVAWLISDILSDNEARTPGFGPSSALKLDRPAAVKTGTTSNFHDNWTVGYTPELVTGVWVGNTSHEPMFDVTGLSGAAPIWHNFMRSVLSGEPESEFARPAGLEQVEVCALSGLLPSEACPYRRVEWFISGTLPHEQDHFYRRVWLDADTGLLADESTPAARRIPQMVLDLPSEAQPWARAEGILLLSDIMPATTLGAVLRLLSPAPNATYRISTQMPANAQRLHIEAVGESGLQEVTLWLDGEKLAARTAPPYEAWWALQPGEHQAWVEGLTADGETVRSEVV